jgi:DNA primase
LKDLARNIHLANAGCDQLKQDKAMHPATLDIASRYHLRRSGARHVGQCPQCGGSSGTDRFVLFDDGGFKCFSCGFKGDRIKWLREIDGLSCKEAHDQEGKGCAPSCPNYGPCREGQPVTRRPRTVAPRSIGPGLLLPTLNASMPNPVWQAWAGALLIKAKALLAKLPEQGAWLESRGIPARLIDHYGLGWLAHDIRPKRSDLGLPVGDGKDQLWVPGGLVIPTFGQDGQVHRLRIRRTPEAMQRFLPERKYEWIRGSGTAPMCQVAIGQCRGVVIVESELDALACAAAHPAVTVVALGTVAGGLTLHQQAICQQAPVILVCLDADPDRDGKLGAGPQAVQRWTNTYRQARYWPVPAGKDPGDYVKDHHGDLRAWIEAGLPPAVCPTVKESLSVATQPHDHGLCPEVPQRGGGGAASEDCQEEPRILVLNDGREIWLTDDQQQWLEWQQQGRIVMSSNELQRLQVVLAGMTAEERAKALDDVLAAKEIFPGAYIRRGVAVAA